MDPPTTELLLRVMPTSVGALTVSDADACRTPAVAVTVVNVSAATPTALIVTPPVVVLPAGIVTEVGAKLRMPVGLPASVTVRSDAIGLARVTVPVTVLLLPPTIVGALSERLRLSGSTVSVSVAGLPAEGVAVIVTGVDAVTTIVEMEIDSVVLPAVNGTGVCGDADGSELVSVTV